MNATATRNQAAFSLVEVMISVLILGVALAGLTQGMATALSSSKDSELQTTAALIATGQIETLRAENDLKDGETEGDCGDALPLYQWKQTISKSDINGLHEVTVVVENARSRQSIYELKTLLFDIPISSLSDDTSKKKNSTGDKKRKRSAL